MPRRKSASSAATPVRKRPSLDFSLTGLVYCAMMMFMGLAAVNTQANLLFGVFGLMIGVLLIAGVISRAVLRRLLFRRVLPEHAVVGKPVTLNYEFENTKRFWPSLSVTISELEAAEAFVKQPCAYLLHAAPRQTAGVPTQVLPKRRGLHVFDRFQLSTSFPFGFIKRALDRKQHETILIFPAIGRVDPQLLETCRSADRSGAAMRPQRGGDDEFYGVKEFRSGQNPRSIYWRRSARTGVLVAKEMTQVSPPKLLLIVDTCVGASRTVEAHAAVERAIAMAASLASHALGAGLMVGLYTWAGDWAHVHPNRGKRHRVDLLAQLAQLPLNTERDAAALLEAGRDVLQSGATAVLITAGAAAGAGPTGPGTVVLSAAESDKWFTFDAEVDFSRSMPWAQQPKVPAAAAGAARSRSNNGRAKSNNQRASHVRH